MSLDELDPLLTPPKRLAALGMLAHTSRVDFTLIRDHLQLSDSDLSKQMAVLAAADYVKVKKTGKGAERRTWYSITSEGQRALKKHVDALNALVLAQLPPPSVALPDEMARRETQELPGSTR